RRRPGRRGRPGAAARHRDLGRLGCDPRGVQPAVLAAPTGSAGMSSRSAPRRRARSRGLLSLARRGLAGLALGLLLPVHAAAQQLTVSAAASLTNAFREIGKQFEAEVPGAVLRFNFGASGVLLQQITQGAPVDVYASADQATLDRGLKQ